MRNRSQNRRKTLLVNEQVQKKIVFHVTLAPLLALFISALTVTVFSGRLAQEAADLGSELPSLGIFFVSVVAFVLVFGLLLIRQALLFSNKVVGPNYRICKTLEQYRNGNPDIRIQLRHGDFNTEIAAEINRLLDWHSQQAQSPSSAAKTDTQADGKAQEEVEATAGIGQ